MENFKKEKFYLNFFLLLYETNLKCKNITIQVFFVDVYA